MHVSSSRFLNACVCVFLSLSKCVCMCIFLSLSKCVCVFLCIHICSLHFFFLSSLQTFYFFFPPNHFFSLFLNQFLLVPFSLHFSFNKNSKSSSSLHLPHQFLSLCFLTDNKSFFLYFLQKVFACSQLLISNMSASSHFHPTIHLQSQKNYQ